MSEEFNEGYRKLHEFNLQNVTFFMCETFYFDRTKNELVTQKYPTYIAKSKVVTLTPTAQEYKYQILIEGGERMTVAFIGYL